MLTLKQAPRSVRREHEREHHRDLLADGEIDARRLRHEDRRQRQVERAAIEVEAVAKRQDEGHDAARHTERLHAFHGPRQGRFRRGRGEGDEGRLLDGLEEPDDRDAEHQHHRQQHQAEEDGQRHVEGEHEVAEVPQDTQSTVADGIGDGRADADRRVEHHDVGDLEHRLGERFAPLQYGLALLAHHAEADGEHHAEDHDLEHVAGGHGLDDRGRHHVQQDLVPGLGLRAHLYLTGGRRQHHAHARLEQVHREEADEERERRDDLEVDDRAQAHPAHVLEMPGPGDPGHQRAEEQRRDDHPDHADEDQAEGPDDIGPARVGDADDIAHNQPENEADHDLRGG